MQSQVNEKLWAAGLHDEAACAALTNPGFEETFPLSAPTLDHPSYRVCGVPLMNGKLDWLMHRGGLTVADSALGNHDYSASDHKWLGADFALPGIAAPKSQSSDDSSSSSSWYQATPPVTPRAKSPLSTCM